MEAILEFVEKVGGWGTVLMFIAYIVLGWPIFKEAIENIFHGEIFDENFLMAVASVASVCIGEVSEALMVIVLYRIGEALEDRAEEKSRDSITNLIDIRPDYANIPGDREVIKVKPEDVKVGDTIVVLPGERVPLDGIVIDGYSRIDTAALTGESMPEDVSKGSVICSGSINLDGMLKLRVTAIASESTAARILSLVEDSAENKAKAESFITKFAHYYTPTVCGIALLIAVIPSLITGDWASWIRKAVIMLVVSCPCALVISIPLGFFGGIGGASKRGILIKGGNHLETLSKVKTIVFDKTGTLTKGEFQVVAIHPEKMKEKKLLELATYAESFSNHPIARSLADEYAKHIDKAKVSDVHELAGQGISADVAGTKVSCGNLKYMKTLGVEAKECELPGTVVHVVVDGEYAGHIVISDVIKEDSADALAALKNLGVSENIMLTGDKEDIAASVAKALPALDSYHAACMPEDKVRITKDLMASLSGDNSSEPKAADSQSQKSISASSKKATLAFIGDGINDAPVLTLADVGIAMGGMGTAAAVEAADIVLMNDKPSDVALAVKISKKTMRIVKENIVFSIGVKVAVLILAAFGLSNIWLAEFADVGVCLLAILNSMRALKI